MESEATRPVSGVMQTQRVVGPGAGAEKYDLLTAMAVNGLATGGVRLASMMRLIALVTARYNWAADEMVIGQREMAALWSVEERTAKRETRRLVDCGLLEIKRPGVRGRVAAYRLCRTELYRQTASDWVNVGPDFDARMTARHNPEFLASPHPNVVRVDFATPTPTTTAHPWDRALSCLSVDQPGLYAVWFNQLKAELPEEGDVLRIYAPSRFIAGYVKTRLLVPLERAVTLGYGRALRCIVVSEGSEA